MKFKSLIRYYRKAKETWHIIAFDYGWKNSFIEGRPLDSKGQAIPWYSYPAIEFLRSLDIKNCRVFEYGCGNSSIFLSQRVKEIFAAENHPAWAAEVEKTKLSNLTIITAEDKERYINCPIELGGKFDIVIVDGRYRKDCAKVAAEVVQDDGFIIFDNADWYPNACDLLRSLGWFQIDFSGPGPINPYAWTTAIFVRAQIGIGRNTLFKPTGGNPSGESKNG